MTSLDSLIPSLIVQETLVSKRLQEQWTPEVIRTLFRQFGEALLADTVERLAPDKTLVMSNDEAPEHDDLNCELTEPHDHFGLAWRIFSQEQLDGLERVNEGARAVARGRAAHRAARESVAAMSRHGRVD